MIHFDFTVSDFDAENIMQIMQAGVTKQNEYILEAVMEGETKEEEWHRQHKAYLIDLIGKMTSSRV